MSPDRENQVGQAFVALADTLVDDYDIIDLLDQLAAHAVALLAADAVGILLGDARRELRAVAASSEDAETMELLQLQSDQGPCLDCFSSVAPVSVPDITTSDETARRWPDFVAAVTRTGAFRSVHALPLRLRGQAIGAMGLLCREPGPLPGPDLELGQALADVATIGILSERAIRHGEIVNEQLQTALNHRVVIEQAKGVIAQTFGVGMDEAFDRLRRHCRAENLRLSEVARRITQDGIATVLRGVGGNGGPSAR
jgi:GAF domain-containing protein